MPAATEGIVRPPHADIPALADATTAHLYSLQTSMVRAAKINLPAFLMLALLLFLTEGPRWFLVVPSGCFLFLAAQAGFQLARFWRPVGRASQLLATQAWRPAPARAEDEVLEIREGDQRWRLHPLGMPAVAAMVVARTERVWIVGPDPQGWLVLRIDGSHAVWPARCTPAADPPETRSEPPTAEEITAAGARTAARHARFRLGRGRDDLALPALIKAGPWQRAAVQLRPWRAHRWSPTCKATATIRLADGSMFEIALRRVGLDVYANAWETGSLWVAGQPVPGGKLAVGFPGYPALGVARVA